MYPESECLQLSRTHKKWVSTTSKPPVELKADSSFGWLGKQFKSWQVLRENVFDENLSKPLLVRPERSLCCYFFIPPTNFVCLVQWINKHNKLSRYSIILPISHNSTILTNKLGKLKMESQDIGIIFTLSHGYSWQNIRSPVLSSF